MHPCSYFIVILLCLLPLKASAQAVKPFDGAEYRNELVGIRVCDLSGKDAVVSYNADLPLVPASLIKLITAATALELLGPDYCFETALAHTGTVKNGVLTGNLIVMGGGDPTLGSRHMGNQKEAYLDTLVERVKQAGITSVEGFVIADASLFGEEPLSPYWIWEDIGNYYAAGIYGLGVNDNSMTIYLKSGKAGSQPVVTKTEPELPVLRFENHLLAADNNKDSAYVYGLPFQWQRHLFGTLPANRSEFSIRGDLPDPPLYVAELFTRTLQAHGIFVKGQPTTTRLQPLSPDTKRNPLGSYRSVPLSRIIRVILEKSDNVYAEYLLRHLAGVSGKKTLTAREGLQVVQDYWKRKGLDTRGLYMVDGSGLSPLNRLSPRFLSDLLTYMAIQSRYASVFEQSLPVAGREGSVAGFLKDTPLAGSVRLKSGSNRTTTCYAGYAGKDDRKRVVVMMVNHMYLSVNQVREDMQEFLLNR